VPKHHFLFHLAMSVRKPPHALVLKRGRSLRPHGTTRPYVLDREAAPSDHGAPGSQMAHRVAPATHENVTSSPKRLRPCRVHEREREMQWQTRSALHNQPLPRR
jgi:hypothetical protein